MTPLRGVATLVSLAVLFVSGDASGQWGQSGDSGRTSFRVDVAGEEHTALVAEIEKDGVSYVPLKDLMAQLGGGYRDVPGRVQVDFARHTAWLSLDGTDVDGSLRRFSLLHPVFRHDDTALMALTDVGPFFDKAFRVSIRHASVPGPPRPQPPGGTDASRVQMQTLPEPGAVDAQRDVPAFPPPLVSDAWQPLPPAPFGVPSEPATVVLPVGPPVVVIDAGHGGSDGGCEGRTGLKEKDLTLAIALRLQKQLQGASELTVFLTRNEDIELTRKERVDIANGQSADVFISIHAGASFAPAAHGFEIFYSATGEPLTAAAAQGRRLGRTTDEAPRSRTLAEAVAASLLDATTAENRGIHEAPCVLLDDLFLPALLLEVGCMTNAAEEDLLVTEAYQARIAQGIASALLHYVASPWGEGTGL